MMPIQQTAKVVFLVVAGVGHVYIKKEMCTEWDRDVLVVVIVVVAHVDPPSPPIKNHLEGPTPNAKQSHLQ